MPRSVAFKSEWMKTIPWLEAVKSDSGKARCKICSTNFDISNGGLSQAKRHGEAKKHLNIVKTLSGETSQVTMDTSNGVLQISRGIYPKIRSNQQARMKFHINKFVYH